MSKIKSAISKLGKLMNHSYANNSAVSSNSQLTPNEKELMAHKRREYLDGVKKELYKYRKKNVILSSPNWNKEFGEKNNSLLNQKNMMKGNCFKNKPSILGGNVRIKKKRRRK